MLQTPLKAYVFIHDAQILTLNEAECAKAAKHRGGLERGASSAAGPSSLALRVESLSVGLFSTGCVAQPRL